MHNAPKPDPADLPTKTSLFRSAMVAGVGALALYAMVYLPAEHGRDPTGVGGLLGLTEMGEIKEQLASEAAIDALRHGEVPSASLMDNVFGLFATPSFAEQVWQDEITFTLAPGEATEIKARMEEGATLTYAWVAAGGRINFDLHAHAGSNDVSYDKGRGKKSGNGSIETPFAGDHGWFWRNRDDVDVTVTLMLAGDYSEIVRED